MKKSLRIATYLLATIIALLAMGCEPSSPKNSSSSSMIQNIYIEVGESPEALQSRYGKSIEVNDKNPGSKFYTIDWSRPNLGEVTLKNGTSQVVFAHALGIMGSYNEDFPHDGLARYSLYLGLSATGTIAHDQARLQFYDMLNRLLKAGWQRYLDDAEPRLANAESIRRLLETTTSITTLDPGYLPTLPEWMTLKERSSWQFYKDHVYMDVRLSRDQNRMDPNLPGAYFVNISLESYASKWRTLFGEADRPRWRELLLDEKENAAQARTKTERQLQAKGYHIDTDYRNPDENEPLIDAPHSSTPPPQSAPPSDAAVSQPPSSLKDRISRWFKND
ncbi:MAG: hypothetical protein QM581_16215 [Pseudomonas sp.]